MNKELTALRCSGEKFLVSEWTNLTMRSCVDNTVSNLYSYVGNYHSLGLSNRFRRKSIQQWSVSSCEDRSSSLLLVNRHEFVEGA